MRTLMEDMLSAGSIQSGHFVVAPRKADLRKIIDDALEIVAPSVYSRGQRVDIVVPQDAAAVMADQRYAQQVLSNLLANASKYSPEQSVIRVLVGSLGTMVRVTVEDEGPGIPAEQQAGLFERFYRVRTDTDAPGVGLGLAIAKGIVEAHGGSIGIDSELGSGTRVWFTLARGAPAET
jgi:signal transduction histidine kinase